VTHEKNALLLECGHGVGGALRAAIELDALSAVILSHMHPDHFFDLVPLHYVLSGRTAPLPVWLPPGGTAVLSALAGALDLGDDFFPSTYALEEYDPSSSLSVAGLQIQFALTKHFVPAYAMRISTEEEDRPTLFFSADTAWTESLVPLATSADLALVEATATGPHDEAGHLSGRNAGRLASESGASRLVLTHYDSAYAEALCAQAAEQFSGPIDLAFEGATFDLR
jgi:ribonuclease BN (tRNA processing enzyme)